VGDARNYGITITDNSIYHNGFGIDLGPNVGPTGNDFDDADTGANTLLNFPALTSATPSLIRGTACVGCRVEVFLADGADNAYGQATKVLGNAVADSKGRFSVAVSGVAAGEYVTATATDGNGNTSEFSLNHRITTKPAPSGMVVAHDTFSRTSSSGWGAADRGGIWATYGALTAFVVQNGSGDIVVGQAGQTRDASLLSVSALNVELYARLKTNKMPAGGSQEAWLVARQQTLGTEYRVAGRRRGLPEPPNRVPGRTLPKTRAESSRRQEQSASVSTYHRRRRTARSPFPWTI